MPAPEETSREELIVLLAQRDARIAAQDTQITVLSTQIADPVEANERLMAQLDRLEHLLSRNSANSRRNPSAVGSEAQAGQAAGGEPGVDRQPEPAGGPLPQGDCECGHDLAGAADLGIVNRYQQHEIPRMSVTVTQYDQDQVRCGCGLIHTAERPEDARSGLVEYGPNLQAFARLPHGGALHSRAAVRRAAGIADRRRPQCGICACMPTCAFGLLVEVDKRFRALITLAYTVCADETPLRVGPKGSKPGAEKAEKYLLVACTELYTHFARRSGLGHVQRVRAQGPDPTRWWCTTAAPSTTTPRLAS